MANYGATIGRKVINGYRLSQGVVKEQQVRSLAEEIRRPRQDVATGRSPAPFIRIFKTL